MVNKFANALKNTKQEEQVKPDSEAVEKPNLKKESNARRGLRHIGGYFTPEVAKQLKQIALEEDTTVQGLLSESLNMIFQSRHRPTIAETKRGTN